MQKNGLINSQMSRMYTTGWVYPPISNKKQSIETLISYVGLAVEFQNYLRPKGRPILNVNNTEMI